MSRFDEAYAREFAAQQERDALDFTVGATVYRARTDRVESGTVRRVGRCNLTSGSDLIERPDGAYPYYVAQFGEDSSFHGDWIGQTYAWKFFATKAGARAELIEDIENHIEAKKREIRALEAKIQALRKEGATSPVPAPDGTVPP